jgi:hypothetical protein
LPVFIPDSSWAWAAETWSKPNRVSGARLICPSAIIGQAFSATRAQIAVF